MALHSLYLLKISLFVWSYIQWLQQQFILGNRTHFTKKWLIDNLDNEKSPRWVSKINNQSRIHISKPQKINIRVCLGFLKVCQEIHWINAKKRFKILWDWATKQVFLVEAFITKTEFIAQLPTWVHSYQDECKDNIFPRQTLLRKHPKCTGLFFQLCQMPRKTAFLRPIHFTPENVWCLNSLKREIIYKQLLGSSHIAKCC